MVEVEVVAPEADSGGLWLPWGSGDWDVWGAAANVCGAGEGEGVGLLPAVRGEVAVHRERERERGNAYL